MVMNNKLDDIKVRFAEESDVPIILEFIKELAKYENMADEVVATEEILMDSLFERYDAEVILGEYENKPVAFALFFRNFSTFLGRAGIYLEDIYVKPEMRGKGVGSIMLAFLAKIAVDRKCSRLEWQCLDWNEPAIGFYKQIGALPMDEWTGYRLHDKKLVKVASQFDEDIYLAL